MPRLPHDIADLHLAPLVLALDARIEDLAALEPVALAKHVALVSDMPAWTRQFRISGLLSALTHLLDCHGWQLSWDTRGVRLTNNGNTLVLGAPQSFADFLAGTTEPEDADHASV